MSGRPISRSLHIHPVFALGVALLLVSLGAFLGQTLFAGMASIVGASVLLLSAIWIVLSLVTIVLGLWRSFEVVGDAQ